MLIKTTGSQKEAQVINVERKVPYTLRYDFEYDTLHPEDKLRGFVMDVKEMVARYDSNVSRIQEIENELSDLEHYMEISSYKNVPEGYKLYRKIAELRRERRACKSENDLLRPVSQYFRTTATLDKIGNVQGDVAKAHSMVDARVYTVRTGVLDEWIKKEDEETKEEVKIAEEVEEEKPKKPIHLKELRSIEEAVM